MEEELFFTIHGNPKALKRHRLTRGNRVYDPSAQDKKDWMLNAQDFCPQNPFTEALEVELEFTMPRAKSHFGSGKNSNILKPSAPKCHLQKPDLDNLVKFVLDAMNGHFYKDDSQIVSIKCSKIFLNKQGEGSTFVLLRPCKKEDV